MHLAYQARVELPAQGQDQAQQAREQAQQIREQAQQIREQAQQMREEALRAAREAAREAARQGRRPDVRVVVPPVPPEPGQQPIVIQRGPWDGEPRIPQEVVDLSMTFIIAMAAVLILRPLMRAFGNRLERRGAAPVLPAEVTAHMERLEHAIEAVAIEVERISEGQRYATKLLTDRAAVGRGEPVPASRGGQ